MTRRLAPCLIALVSVGFSLALACAMPFAGLAALSALVFSVRAAVLASLLAWAMNQAVGYGLLAYPVTVDSIAWGLVLGASAVAAVLGAFWTAGIVSGGLRWPATLLSAFAAQQATVYLASFILPSHPEAFALPIIASLFAINALAFAVLLLLCLAVPAMRGPALKLAQ